MIFKGYFKKFSLCLNVVNNSTHYGHNAGSDEESVCGLYGHKMTFIVSEDKYFKSPVAIYNKN